MGGSACLYLKKFSFDVMGDVGGFDVGSELTWQALPMLNWHFSKWGSIQAGYRWLFTDYSQGSGSSQFRYNILTQGPQVGFHGAVFNGHHEDSRIKLGYTASQRHLPLVTDD